MKVGDKIKGFKFESEYNGIQFQSHMLKYIGVEGKIEYIPMKENSNIPIRFPDGELWYYPRDMVITRLSKRNKID